MRANRVARLIFDFFGVWKSKACGSPRFLHMGNERNQNSMSSVAAQGTAPSRTRPAGGPFDISRVLKIENPTETLGSCEREIKDIKAETGDRECEPRGGELDFYQDF